MIKINKKKLKKFWHYLISLRYVKLVSYLSTKRLQQKMYDGLIKELVESTKKLTGLENGQMNWLIKSLYRLFPSFIKTKREQKIKTIKEKILQLNKDISKRKYLTYDYKGVYYYGFQIIYGAINKFALLIIVGILFHALPQILIATLAFCSIRVWIGGLHFNSYTKCAYVSLLCLVTAGLFSKYIPFNSIANIVVFSTLFMIALIYAPIEHPNRVLQLDDKKRYKYTALVLICVVYSIQWFINDTNIKNSMMYGVLLAGIIALPMFNKQRNCR